MDAHDDAALFEERDRLVRELVESPAALKVAVAGPGTGKTRTFAELLKGKTGDKIALTFVNNLVESLRVDLAGLAEVQTLHGFAKVQLYKHPGHGLSRGCDYYPSFTELLHRDASIVLGNAINYWSVEGVLHEMEDGDLLDAVIASGEYYDAVGHTDSVYRVVRHLQEHPADIPRYAQIVVDEFQDFSLLEVTLIKLLADVSPTLIVGDDDQALYFFKHAMADYLRDVAAEEAFAHFELPFCSRCTAVLVDAVDRIVRRAQLAGLLAGRVPKRYECFTPIKRADSELYPKIIHAECTVELNNAPYICKYVERAIEAIPPEHVDASKKGGYPTVLVIGPKPFNVRVAEHLIENGVPNVTLPRSSKRPMDWLDAYRRLARRSRSRLGWRIAIQLEDPGGRDGIIRAALAQGKDLFELLPAEYRERHLAVAGLVARVKADERLDEEDVGRLEAALARPFLDVRRLLGLAEDELPQPEVVEGEPTIAVTSMMGAKGLQAEYVFVVGMNAPHFPDDNAAPTEHEVCCMLVALTRATKCCHLVSCKRFAHDWLQPSVSIGWLGDAVQTVTVDKSYFATG